MSAKDIKIAVILVLAMLSGCTKQIQTEYRTHYTTFEDDWLKDCPLVPPPDRELYRNATEKQRNLLWTKVYGAQAKQQKKCWNDSAAARNYNELMKQKNKEQSTK